MLHDPLISVQDLSKSYGEGESAVEVFAGLNMEVQRGEILTVMGPSGVGKSTLLHILGGLDTPTGGSVRVDGEEISAMNEEERVHFRRERIGMVFQFHHLLEEFTLIENVAIPLLILKKNRKEAFDRAEELTGKLGLKGKENRFSQELSGGEQQRAALARAMVSGATILLADEPTGNLDRETEVATLELIRELHGQNSWTSVIVTHNENLISYSDRLLRFEEGAVRSYRV